MIDRYRCDPKTRTKLTRWIPSFPGIIGPFIGFIIFWPNYRSIIFLSVWVWVFKIVPISIGHFSCQYEVEFFSRPHLYWSVIHLVSSVFRTAPISIDHCLVSLSLSPQDRNYITRLSSVSVCVLKAAPISIGHLSISSVQLSFSGPHLYWLIIHCLISSVWVKVAPISIGHLPISLVRLRFLGPHLYWSIIYLSYPFEFEFLGPHIYRSAIFLSVCIQFEFLGPHLYQSIIDLVNLVRVLGPHLYWSVIILSIWVWVFGIKPISIGHSSCHYQFDFLRPHLYRSIIFHVSMRLSFSGLHLYRSIIVLSIQFDFFGTASILIGHHLISLSLSFQDPPILIGHSFFHFSLSFLGPHLYRSVIVLSVWVWVFRDRTYIDRSFILSVLLEFWGHTYINWSFLMSACV